MTRAPSNQISKALFLLALTAPSAAAQVDGTRFGRGLLVLGDLNGDGVQEIAVGAPAAKRLYRRLGLVIVLCGATRKTLQVWQGDSDRDFFGHSLQDAGDMDDDGIRDVIVGYERPYQGKPHCEVRSGRCGFRLHTFDVPADGLFPFGDFNGDGYGDLLVTADGRMEIRSGRYGRLLGMADTRIKAPIYSVGDLDGDGFPDVVQGSEMPMLMLSAITSSAPVTRLLRQAPYPEASRNRLSASLPESYREPDWRVLYALPGGDLNGDGDADMVLTLQRDEQRVLLGVSLDESSPLFFERGKTHGGREAFQLGYSVTLPGDLDGDGRADVVIGGDLSAFGQQIRARRRTGYRYLESHWARTWKGLGSFSGTTVATVRDHDGDNVPDILVATSDWIWHGTVQPGHLQLLSGRTGEVLWNLDDAEVEALHSGW